MFELSGMNCSVGFLSCWNVVELICGDGKVVAICSRS
jgi:hypothetical protein